MYDRRGIPLKHGPAICIGSVPAAHGGDIHASVRPAGAGIYGSPSRTDVGRSIHPEEHRVCRGRMDDPIAVLPAASLKQEFSQPNTLRFGLRRNID